MIRLQQKLERESLESRYINACVPLLLHCYTKTLRNLVRRSIQRKTVNITKMSRATILMAVYIYTRRRHLSRKSFSNEAQIRHHPRHRRNLHFSVKHDSPRGDTLSKKHLLASNDLKKQCPASCHQK